MSNTDLIKALIKCGKVLASANTPTQHRYAQKYRELTRKFFQREIKQGTRITYTQMGECTATTDRSKVASNMLWSMRNGKYD